MDTVVDLTNLHHFINENIMICLPRTVRYDEYQKYLYECTNDSGFNSNYVDKVKDRVFISLGINDIKLLLDNLMLEVNLNQKILIDVANGHMKQIVDYCKKIKQVRPDIIIMVGNIANPETYRWYAENECVDYVRISIGNGNGCLTSKQSAIGFPMASLIYEISTIKEQMINNKTCGYSENQLSSHIIKNYPKIIADGGMKEYSDIIKAFALGADGVMVGSIFNKSLESCSQNYFHGIKVSPKIAKFLFNHNYEIKKHFRGMSTKGAQKAMGKTSFRTSEGVDRFRKVEYHLDGWMENLKHYLRNAMSYTDSYDIEEFINNDNIIQITPKSYDRFNK
jgi:hypothetical protein